MNEEFSVIFFPEEIKLRVVQDFDPKQMNVVEKKELQRVLCKGRLVKKIEKSELYERTKEEERLAEITMVTNEIGDEQRCVLNKNERQQHRFAEFDMRKDYDIVYDREVPVHNWKDNGSLQEFRLTKQDKQINPKDELLALGNEGHIKPDIQNQEEAIKLGDFDSYIAGWKQLMYDTGYMQYKDNPYTTAITIKRGDELETIPPTNIR